MYVSAPCTCIKSPETGAADGFEPPYESWDSNLGPQKEQQVLLTTKSFVMV